MADKATEESLVAGIAQFFCEGVHERLAAGVVFHRVLRIVGDVHDHGQYHLARRQVFRKNNDAGEARRHDQQLVAFHGLAAIDGRVSDQVVHGVIAATRQVVFDQGHVQREFQRGELAVYDLVAQAGLGHGVALVQVVVEIALVLAADVQLAAQGGELRDADFRGDGRQRLELPGRGRLCGEVGVGFIAAGQGFGGLEVVQGRVQQGDAPGPRRAGFDGKADNSQGNIELQVGSPDIGVDPVLTGKGLLQHLGTKVCRAFERGHGAVYLVLGGPGIAIEALELLMLRLAGVFVPVGDDRRGVGQRCTLAGRGVAEPLGQGVFQDLVVGNSGCWRGAHGVAP
ncbi:hypothetical protein PS687_04537 [Pseudomonas fluorescens]|nr:hypothetical protein PS687_04537 [Pseudomonas fluorescens]